MSMTDFYAEQLDKHTEGIVRQEKHMYEAMRRDKTVDLKGYQERIKWHVAQRNKYLTKMVEGNGKYA